MLKIAIVGCGLIAIKKHIPSFLKIKNKTKIVALCDFDEDALKKTGNRFNIKNIYTDLSLMLLREHPDIVDICTPPQSHAKLAIQAIENNSHVILEKPMAVEIGDCDAMVEAALRHRREICVIHNQIFNPAFIKARRLVSKGEIGDFLGMRIFLSTPTDYMTSKEQHWVHKLPGGVLGETGPHAVYIALSYLEDVYDASVNSRKSPNQYPWSCAEDFRINLIAKNGIASIVLIYGSNQWAAVADVIGTKGILKIDFESQIITRYNRPSLAVTSVGRSVFGMVSETLKTTASNGLRLILGKYYNAHTIGIREFVESILKGGPVAVSAEDGREAVRVMKMIVEKLKSSKGGGDA